MYNSNGKRRNKTGKYDLIEAAVEWSFKKENVSDSESSSYERNVNEDSINEQSLID
ncbi:MAG: hypothetical protein PV340_00765 [Wolbachia sp.]|nr:hypothetical protein [Wolbachia sp.]MDD9335918.1 hypothetical protein [Wolbachia sp.]